MCSREAEAEVIAAYEQFDGKHVGAHRWTPFYCTLNQ